MRGADAHVELIGRSMTVFSFVEKKGKGSFKMEKSFSLLSLKKKFCYTDCRLQQYHDTQGIDGSA